MIDSFDQVFSNKNRVLIVLAHPDDMEIICGGTVARLIKNGKQVRSVITTDGQRGMHQSDQYSNEEFAKIRLNSQIAAGLELGITKDNIFNLGFPDGQVENTFENIGKVVWHFRDFKPDIVITHKPVEVINWYDKQTGWVNHRDHRMTAELTLDAAYPYSNDHGFYREQLEAGLTGHSVSEFLFSDSYTEENAVGFDVSEFLETKHKALKHHMDGGVLSAEEVEGFMEEIAQDNGNFEVLGWVKLG